MKQFVIFLFLVQINLSFGQEKFEVAVVEKFQEDLNVEYADAKTSPLTAEDLAQFKSLHFYPINNKAFVVAQFIRTQDEKPFEMPTSGTRRPMYVKYGEARFELEGKEFKLNIYRNIELSKKEEYKTICFCRFRI